MPEPFFAKRFDFKQPDGTILPVKGWGNQHFARFETLDGFTVVKDPVSGFYQYAKSENGVLKASGAVADKIDPQELNLTPSLRSSSFAARNAVRLFPGLPPLRSRWKERWNEQKQISRILTLRQAPPARGTIGHFTGLCLMIQFPDIQGIIEKEEVNAFCNRVGYSGFGNKGSVFDYFLQNSSGRLQYNNLVVDYYTAKNPRDYYTNPAVRQPDMAQELITEALTDLSARGFDFSVLTADSEEMVFAVNVLYAGPVVNNWSEGLWPHSGSLSSPLFLAPGKFAYDYQITDMGNELSLGTFCHENGHLICSFPDLYDYGDESFGTGFYCLMSGSGNADKFNPMNICAYLKFKAGWTDKLTNLETNLSIELDATKNEFAILRRGDTEYFLIENRQRKDRDQSIPDDGLAIWHVDELGSNSDEEMTPSSHYECSLIQADGLSHLERKINQGDETDLFKSSQFVSFSPTTTPSSDWWDGSSSGLFVSNISPSGTKMTFTAAFQRT